MRAPFAHQADVGAQANHRPVSAAARMLPPQPETIADSEVEWSGHAQMGPWAGVIGLQGYSTGRTGCAASGARSRSVAETTTYSRGSIR